MTGNIIRLRDRLNQHRVEFRPHLKTAKSIEVARRLLADPTGPITVSTLKEAEQFAAAGVRNILYAVGIAPNKLSRVIQIRRSGIDLSIVIDSQEQACAVASASKAATEEIPTLIEIDSDGHRAGVGPDSPELLAIGKILAGCGALRGIMTHAGGSYNQPGPEALTQAAEQERTSAVQAAERLRAAGFPCPVVSVGSTPTAHFARDYTGVTEVRAGVFVFFDLVMLGLGVCALEDLALSVLATVIGHQKAKGWILIDAGWMAMSRDRGTARQKVDQGYGIACDIHGRPFRDLILNEANQEHGILTIREGSAAPLPDLPLGSLVRILPNHACATSAQHDRFHVLGPNGDITAQWPRFSGW